MSRRGRHERMNGARATHAAWIGSATHFLIHSMRWARCRIKKKGIKDVSRFVRCVTLGIARMCALGVLCCVCAPPSVRSALLTTLHALAMALALVCGSVVPGWHARGCEYNGTNRQRHVVKRRGLLNPHFARRPVRRLRAPTLLGLLPSPPPTPIRGEAMACAGILPGDGLCLVPPGL